MTQSFSPTYASLLDAIKRIANPEDSCHCDTSGPWQDVAQEALLGKPITDGGEWYSESGLMSTDELMASRNIVPRDSMEIINDALLELSDIAKTSPFWSEAEQKAVGEAVIYLRKKLSGELS